MLSCKKCGAQMSGIDLVCKNCGTPWGKKHKSNIGIYLSALSLVIVGAVSYILYIPGVKENFTNFYNNVFTIINESKENLPVEKKSEEIIPKENNEIVPIVEEEVTPTPVEEIVVEESPITYGPPTFSWVSASSTLKDYPAEYTTDGKLETVWLEGVKGNGVGEWVMYSAEKDQSVSSITLFNGYLKNDKVYANNGRIKKLSIEFSDGEIITKDIAKVSFSNAKNGYKIELDAPKITNSIKLTILDTYQGAYYTDTGFSEIKFN